MILIKDIEFIETLRDPYEIISQHSPFDFVPAHTGKDEDGEIPHVEVKEIIELVKGRRFCRPDGTEIIIGISKQAENVIGIQYEAWEEIKENRDFYRNSYNEILWKMGTIEKSGIWQRIKYLFVGMNNLFQNTKP